MTQHPGAVLQEYMQARAMRISQLATLSGVSQATIHKILRGTGRITPSTAVKLALAFQGSPVFWLRLQYEYTLFCMAQEEEEDRFAILPEEDEGYLSDEILAARITEFFERPRPWVR